MENFGENIWDVSSWISDINWKDGHLHRYFDSLSFEECIDEVLDIVETYFQSVYQSYNMEDEEEEEEEGVEIDLPYLDIIVLLAEEYLYGHYFHGITPIQEFLLLEKLCAYFQKNKLDSVRYLVFDCIFGLPTEISDLQKGLLSFKVNLIYKLTSLAIGTSCGNVLNCVAVWLCTYGTQHHRAAKLAYHVINDYCFICPSTISAIKQLLDTSPVFANQFVLAMFVYYKETDKETSTNPSPPVELIDIISDWIIEQPNFCSLKVPRLFLQLPSIHSYVSINNTPSVFKLSPLLQLLEWSICEPLTSNDETHGSYSKLHFALVSFLYLQKKIEVSPPDSSDDLEPGELLEENEGVEFISKRDISYLVNSIRQHLECKGRTESGTVESLNRLIQALQVGKWSKAIILSSKQLNAMLADLPKTRLMQAVIKLYC